MDNPANIERYHQSLYSNLFYRLCSLGCKAIVFVRLSFNLTLTSIRKTFFKVIFACFFFSLIIYIYFITICSGFSEIG